MCMMSLLSSLNFEQNIEHNRLEINELPERKIGGNKSKMDLSLVVIEFFSILLQTFISVSS